MTPAANSWSRHIGSLPVAPVASGLAGKQVQLVAVDTDRGVADDAGEGDDRELGNRLTPAERAESAIAPSFIYRCFLLTGDGPRRFLVSAWKMRKWCISR